METSFIDNTLTNIETNQERISCGQPVPYICEVLEDAALCIRTLKEELETKELRKAEFLPGEIVYIIMGTCVREGKVRCSGFLYDEKHTEPLHYAGLSVNIDGVWIQVKYTNPGATKLFKTKEEAEDELRRKSTNI